MARNNSGSMSVREAGQIGGRRTSETHGRDFYRRIGKKGGDRVSELISRGKRSENSQ